MLLFFFFFFFIIHRTLTWTTWSLVYMWFCCCWFFCMRIHIGGSWFIISTEIKDFCRVCTEFSFEEISGCVQSLAHYGHLSIWWPCLIMLWLLRVSTLALPYWLSYHWISGPRSREINRSSGEYCVSWATVRHKCRIQLCCWFPQTQLWCWCLRQVKIIMYSFSKLEHLAN